MNSARLVEKIELDATLEAEQRMEHEQLVQTAMIAHQEWRAAEQEAANKRKSFDQAAARLAPLRNEIQQVAA